MKRRAIGPGSEVKGISVNPEGEGRHRHARTKMARTETENQTTSETGSGGSESEQKSYSCGISRDAGLCERLVEAEAEEISFVPSVLSIPRGPMFWCDNRCSDKALSDSGSLLRLLSMTVRMPTRSTGVNSATTKKVVGIGPGAVEVLAVEDNGGTKNASWQIVVNFGRGPAYTLS